MLLLSSSDDTLLSDSADDLVYDRVSQAEYSSMVMGFSSVFGGMNFGSNGTFITSVGTAPTIEFEVEE
jgi:hypothetical protein